jgi:hypothetical protein
MFCARKDGASRREARRIKIFRQLCSSLFKTGAWHTADPRQRQVSAPHRQQPDVDRWLSRSVDTDKSAAVEAEPHDATPMTKNKKGAKGTSLFPGVSMEGKPKISCSCSHQIETFFVFFLI